MLMANELPSTVAMYTSFSTKLWYHDDEEISRRLCPTHFLDKTTKH
jgi:hypothetical protein